MNLFDMSPLKEKEAHFRRLLDVANLGALTPQERAIYDENLKIYRDWKATMEYAVENAEAKGSRLTALRTAWNLKRIGLDTFCDRPMYGAFLGGDKRSGESHSQGRD